MTAGLVTELRSAVRGEVDAVTRRRAEYSSDASNYRVVPEVVVFPRDTDDLVAVLETARSTATPLTMRGGGTSVAGNAIGPGIVVDTSRHLTGILDLDPEARTATVQPGVVLGDLQREAGRFGLRFGPDPSTWARATLGGMIGNNACGSHSLAYGRTADTVRSMDVVDGRGRRLTVAAGEGLLPGLDEFTNRNLALFRTGLGSFGRQISGYSLEHLLPENGRDLAKALVGTEGTCVAVLAATVDLVPVRPEPVLAVLGFADMIAAAEAVPAILAHRPASIEGLDARLVDAVRRARDGRQPVELPRGGGWLIVEFSGGGLAANEEQARGVVRDSGAVGHRILSPGPEARAIARIREDGAGLAGRTETGKQAWPGFEDAAVPPEQLGAYLRDFDRLMTEFGIEGMPYGHFGDGCVHVRLDIPLDHDASVLRSFATEAARLVAGYGGSLSGEHGDGRARSELLPLMYSPELLAAFAEFKAMFDPGDLLNPGVIVHPAATVQPAAIDADLRRPAALPLLATNGFAFEHDGGDFTTAVHRCVGVGSCRADNSGSGGVMCPSFLATRDEKDSTRGRARVLQEMANGTLVTGGWRSPEVADALDLCLSCKACASDCPAGVDMAEYKSEALHRAYEHRLRPASHYLLGWLPRWARLVAPVAGLANRLLAIRPVRRLVLLAGGMDRRRTFPRFAERSFSRGHSRPPVTGTTTRQVLLWVDSFSDNFTPAIALDAITVLESAGYEVIAPASPVCCGLTWITTGQLGGAKRILGHLLDEFSEAAARGIPIVGLEPSCTAVLRSDLVSLFPGDARAEAVSGATRTLAELLTASDWTPPRLDGLEVVVQPHCHHHAVMGFDTDRALLERLGATISQIDGCCGLAGNFGMERGHYDVSVAIAENGMLPALRERAPGSVFLADGFSCRTQAEQLGATTDGIHLAQLLAGALSHPSPNRSR